MAKPLELKDSKIDKLDTAFYVDLPNGTSKQVEKVRYNFPNCKGQQCQWLGLLHKRKSGHKTMFLDYWLNTNEETILKSGIKIFGKSKRYILGNYDKKDFNVRMIEKKISDLRELYGNPNNLTWDKNIHAGEQLKKRGAYAAQLEELKNYTINQVIESFYEHGCPKINKPSESMNRTTISGNARYLIGYNERTTVLKISNDEAHTGVIGFKERSGINSIKELFNKYPAKEYSNYGAGVSIYDSPLGQQNIKDLTEHDVRNYINTVATSPGTQRQIKETISYIWNHAANRLCLEERL